MEARLRNKRCLANTRASTIIKKVCNVQTFFCVKRLIKKEGLAENKKEQEKSQIRWREVKEGCAVIFIHGIVESPKQFRRLAQIVAEEGCDPYILLLPGHGGSSEQFAKTNFKAWITYVSREINRRRRDYKMLILVGHSMGALLCLCEAAHHKAQIMGLVLLDSPMKIHLWPRVLRGAYKIARGKVKVQERYVVAEYKAMGVAPVKLPSLTVLQWAKRYLELYTMIKYTRKQVMKVQAPALMVFAKKDEFVSLKSSRYLAVLQGETLYLQESGHFCYHHSDLDYLEEHFRRFIRKQRKVNE